MATVGAPIHVHQSIYELLAETLHGELGDIANLTPPPSDNEDDEPPSKRLRTSSPLTSYPGRITRSRTAASRSQPVAAGAVPYISLIDLAIATGPKA